MSFQKLKFNLALELKFQLQTNMKNILLLLFFVLFLADCSVFGKKQYEQQLKSPCVSLKNGGCEHIPVNTWLDSTVYKQVYNQEKA